MGIRRALLAADCCGEALDRSLRFLILSQTVRLIMTVLPACMGLSPVSSVALLLSGLGMDLLCMLTYATLPLGDVPAQRRSGESSLRRLWLRYRTELWSAVIGAAFPWVVMEIACLFGARVNGDPRYYGFLCIIGLQFVIFRADRLPGRDRRVFMTTLILGLLFVGCLAAALASGLSALWVIPVPLTVPRIYLGARSILDRIQRSKASKKASEKRE